MTDVKVLKRLYRNYSKKYLKNILISVFFTVLLAGSTSSVAYLLDPAIKQLFIERKQTLIYVIPGLIVLAFAVKGGSLYVAKVIMIRVAEEVKKDIQMDVFSSLIKADTQLVDNKHSGKFISNLTNDVNMITNLVSTAILNLFKDSLTLIGLLGVMFYQNWKLSLIAIIMIPLASAAARTLGKRIGKVTSQQMTKAGALNSYLIEIFKNHKLMKIFQKEEFEKKRANNYINDLKETSKKINEVFVRASPIMEFLTGIMIAFLIFVSAKLISNNELEVSNFFSFLAAMMLAYQPVRSLATLNISIQQGISGARRVLPIIDDTPAVKENENSIELIVNDAQIQFKNIKFEYYQDQKGILKSINLNANASASKKEIEEAAKYSYADEFIEKLPNKYDTLIGENGVRLSGGEKQRLSIARAILKKSPIILLDEATSSLDAETENKIQEAINFLTQGRTTIVIAHRLSTILNSDKIYVIDQGEIIGEGKHNELLKSSDQYKNFYEKQIRKE